jgi:hypothetical protein
LSGDTKIVEIEQMVGANQLGHLPTLPSAIYVPHREEFPEGSFPLPWNDAGEPAIVGQFARDRGTLVPDRLVTSAKSWLSNPHVDPKQPILPWRSDITEEKLSPFECSRRYLQHLRDALLYAFHTAKTQTGSQTFRFHWEGAWPDRFSAISTLCSAA